MNPTARSLIALASATTLAASVAISAYAAPVDVFPLYECVDGTEYELRSNSSFDGWAVEDAAIFEDADCSGFPLVDDAFDGLWAIWLDFDEDVSFYGHAADGTFVVDRTVASNGDVVLTGPVESIFGLDVQVEIRLYATGDMVRVLVTYTNPSGAPITVTTGSASGYGSDADIEFLATSSGDAAPPTAADNWSVTSDGDATDPVLSNAWQSATSAWRATGLELYGADGDVDNMLTGGDLTVAPGATVRLAYFTKIYGYQREFLDTPELAAAALIATDIAEAEAAAIAGTSEWGSFAGRLTAGLANGTVVLNWGTVGGTPPPANPARPATGRPTFTG